MIDWPLELTTKDLVIDSLELNLRLILPTYHLGNVPPSREAGNTLPPHFRFFLTWLEKGTKISQGWNQDQSDI